MKRALYRIGLVLLLSSGSSLAFAEHSDADRQMYEAFVRYLAELPLAQQIEECQRFLEEHPGHAYRHKIEDRLSVLEAVSLAREEASSEEAAVILAVDVPAPSPPPTPTLAVAPAQSPVVTRAAAPPPSFQPPSPPPNLVEKAVKQPALRAADRFGVGTDFSIGALLGFPSFMVEYSVTDELSFGGALRFPMFSMTQVAFEPRLYLSPKTPASAYTGVTMGALTGDIDSMVRFIDPAARDFRANSAFAFGILGGVQTIFPPGEAFYLEVAYQWVSFTPQDSRDKVVARFPSLSVGYRFFF